MREMAGWALLGEAHARMAARSAAARDCVVSTVRGEPQWISVMGYSHGGESPIVSYHQNLNYHQVGNKTGIPSQTSMKIAKRFHYDRSCVGVLGKPCTRWRRHGSPARHTPAGLGRAPLHPPLGVPLERLAPARSDSATPQLIRVTSSQASLVRPDAGRTRSDRVREYRAPVLGPPGGGVR